MPLLGRSRSMRLRKGPSEDEISQPVLIGTDAAPRKDLYMLKTPSPVSGTNAVLSSAATRNNRPRTASDEGRKGIQPKSAPIVAPSYDQSFGTTTYSPTTYHNTEAFEDPTIGMALGSPSHAAPWNRVTSTVDSVSSGPSVSSGTFSDPPEQETTKGPEKISRWKSLFGRKATLSPPTTPFYQVQRQPTPIGRTNSDQPRHVIVPKLDSITSPKDRKLINTALYSPLPAEVQRSKTGKKSPYREEWSPKPPPKDHVSSPQIPKVTINSPASTPNQTSTTPKSSGMMLDIDIPKSEMERYSVMFSNVLRPDQSLSLLARRKGNNGEMLKPLDEFTVNTQSANSRLIRPTRRATSPSYKSPSFTVSLFPPHDPRSTRSRTPSPANEPTPPPSLQRSFTEPAISPNRSTFSGKPESKLSKTPPSGFTFGIEEFASSPVELSAEDTMVAPTSAAVSHKPKFDEPSWSPATHPKERTASPVAISPQTVVPKSKAAVASSSPRVASPLASPPTTNALKPLTEALKSSPPRATSKPAAIPSPLREHPVATSQPERSDDASTKRSEPERNNDGIVQVAIARQVSVSRTRPRLEADERLVERKGMTPRVVKLEVSKRKSHRVQIVEG